MKKIISFSLWGNDLKYVHGAIQNAKISPEVYPGWVCRFYIGQSTIQESKEIVSTLKSFSHVEVIEMKEDGGWESMFWRFLPCSDYDVEIILSRDCDSRLNTRESEAVKEWLESEKMFHIMRDHPLHRYLILGGMWGARTEKLRDMEHWITEFPKGNYWNIDQEFLEQIVYPKIRNDCLIHDEFNSRNHFPKRRRGLEFVGEVVDGFNNPDPIGRVLLLEEINKRKAIKWKLNYLAEMSNSLLARILKRN